MNLLNKLEGVFNYFEFSRWKKAHTKISMGCEVKNFFIFVISAGVVLAGTFIGGNTILYFSGHVKFNYYVPGVLLTPFFLSLVSIVGYDTFYRYRLSYFNKKVRHLNEEQLRKIIGAMKSYSGHSDQYDDLILAFHKNKDNMGEVLFSHLEPLYEEYIEQKITQEDQQLIKDFKNPSAAKLKKEAEAKFKFMDN